MIRDILIYEENKDILTQKSELVDNINDEIKTLIQDLKDTLLAQPTGVGISAIQIGVPKRVCVIKYNNELYTLINPIITRKKGETVFEEGCLSAPEKKKQVKRAQKVWCNYIDDNGKEREIANGGLCSVIIQHELDHFEGWCEIFSTYENENSN